MAVEISCTACADIREEVPELVVNGFDDEMCASLKNDTGLKASSGNDDCTDIDNLVDCLIGNMDTEIDDYDTCDWKDFMKKYIPNAWTVLKSITCAICGLWTNIHSIASTIDSLCITKTDSTISLVSDHGTHCSVTDSDTKYDLTKSGNNITLTGSDGSSDTVTLSDTDTRYQMHTKTYNSGTITLAGDASTTIDINAPQPSEYADTLYPMAIAGWEIEGSGTLRLVTRYIQLVDRSGSPKIRAVIWNAGTATAEFVLKGEVLWWGLNTH